MKSHLRELADLLESQPGQLPRKRLEQIRGFMNYVCQTYRYLIPYLNGLHMTIDGFRPNRTEDGWKIPVKPGDEPLPPVETPTEVEAKPRLFADVEALTKLTEPQAPPWRRQRPLCSASLYYGMGDASGAEFGAALQHSLQSTIHYARWYCVSVSCRPGQG